MAQHDMNIANQSFPSFRTDLNNALAAINSMHSGTSRPSSATTGTLWLDTTNSGSNSLEIKFFDGSDDISVATIDTSANTINFLDSVVTGINILTDTSPQLGGNLDVNGNDIVSASNGDVDLDPNGSGVVVFKGNSTKGAGQFKLNCEQNSHGITIKGPPHSAAASYTLTLPNTDGDADQVLKTDGSGVLSFSSVSALSGSGIQNVVEDTTPQLGGQLDVNGNAIGDGTLELLKFSETASAVNELTITNAATGNGPSISSTGDDSNVDLSLTPKGIGRVVLGAAKIEQIAEKVTNGATAFTGTINFDVMTQAVFRATSNASGNWTLNIRGDSSNSLDSIMDTGESISIVTIVPQGGSAYYNSAVQIDGSSVTPKYQGGSAPSSGNASSDDVYTYTIIKTGSASFAVYASQSQFA